MEINKEPQYFIKWCETTPLLLATGLQVPDNQTVMEKMKSSIISGMNPRMEEKILLEADTQEEEVLQEEALQMGVPPMMTMTMKVMRDHYHGNLLSDLLVNHLPEDHPWVLNP